MKNILTRGILRLLGVCISKRCLLLILTIMILIVFINNANSQVIFFNNPAYEKNQLVYGDLTIYTDKEVYLIGEKVNITVENTGKVGIGGSPKLYIKNITDESNERTVHTADPNDLPEGLYESESFSYSWNQLDENNSEVSSGLYLIHFYYVCCGGISIRNSTTFEIKNGPISIESMKLGIGTSIYLKNIASFDVNKVTCTMTVRKDNIIKNSKTITIEQLKPDETNKINFYPFGLGPYEIDFQTISDGKTVSCYLIGPFVFV